MRTLLNGLMYMIQQDKSLKLDWEQKSTHLDMLYLFIIIMLSFIMIKPQLWFWSTCYTCLALFYDFSASIFLMTGWWDKGKPVQLHSLWNGAVSAKQRRCDPKGPQPFCPSSAEEPRWDEEGLHRPGQEDWHHLPSLLPISLFDF